MTGFYVALNEDNGAGMAGFSPEAVLRTLSGLQVVQGGCESVAPVSAAPPGRHTGTVAGPLKRKKAHPAGWAFYLFDAWQFPTLTWGDPTLPSALRRFTSEFGMGSGGTTALSPPGKFCFQHVLRTHRVICIRAENSLSNPPKQLRRCKVKPHGSLVPVSSTHRCAYTPGLSTSSSSTFLQET